MTSAFLVHWHEGEVKERAARLRAAGYTVRSGWQQGGEPGRALVRKLPDVVVIDLGRLPSHGRQLATWLRENQRSRCVPIVFVAGDAEKTARVAKDFPESVVTTWSRIKSGLKRALAHPPKDVAAPRRHDYSGTPLAKKLGVKADGVVALLGAPKDFERTLGALPDGVRIRKRAQGACDVIVLFSKSRADLERRFAGAHRALADGGGLWIAWPKKTAGIPSDLTQPVVQAVGLASGLVDNKICAVDETWSGLRFMRRRK